MRAITFPKTGDGVWTNRETMVRIVRTPEGAYLVRISVMENGRREFVCTGASCDTLKQAREVATREVERMRAAIVKAYIEAVDEHVERAAAADAGAASWRVDAARRAVIYARSDRSGHWLASALNEVRRIEDARKAIAATAAQATDAADAVHFDHSFGEPIACGATGQVRVTSRRMDVTCEGCKGALDARDFDRAHADLATAYGTLANGHPGIARAMRLRGTREGVEALHEIAADLDIADRRCTMEDGWLQPHPFEYDPGAVEAARAGNDGYDEYERCGQRRDHTTHQQPKPQDCRQCGRPAQIVGGQAEHLDPPPHVNGIHAADLPDASAPVLNLPPALDSNDPVPYWPTEPRFPAGTPEYEAYRRDLNVELKKFSAGEHPYEYGIEFKTQRMPRAMTAAQLAAYRSAGDTIRSTTRSEGSSRHMVPADVNDDDAWAAYCAMLPAPTDEQVAAVVAEYAEPYAEQIAQCVESFRSTARLLWSLRHKGELSDERYSTLRRSMKVFRDCIDTYRGLAAGQRAGEVQP